jgi:hypothetical protein
MKARTSAFIAWGAATIFYGVVGGSHVVPRLLDLYALTKSYKTEEGEIVAGYPQAHNTCTVRFTYNSKEYINSERSCGHLSVGDKAVVYFLQNNPNVSENDDPSSVFINDLVSFISEMILFPLFAGYVTYRRFEEPTEKRAHSAHWS